MRADQLLVERGLAASRSQAQRLIAGGMRWHDGRDWRRVAKNGDEVPGEARIELADDAEARYVSRGGLKLEGALAATGLGVAGWRCLDVGQSTGGFTDCLLAHGVQAVVGDLSFISLTLVLPAVAPLVKAGGHLLMLVKPQFELQPADIGKGGVVRDAAMYPRVEARIREACAAAGLTVRQWLDSPIEGGDGNREFFVYATTRS